MKKIFDLLFLALSKARKRALPFTLATLCFLLVMFPYDDLGELVATKVAQVTQGQVSLNFDRLGLRFFPPGLDLSDVYIESTLTPALSAKSVGIAPDILGFISFRPGVSLSAEGLLGGEVDLTIRTGSKTEKGVATQKISLQTEGLKLSELQKTGMLPLNLDGNVDLDANLVVDPSLAEQPDGEVTLQIQRFNVPDLFPGTNLKKVQLKGTLKNGKFTISDGTVGEANDDISGKITGHVDLRVIGAAGNYSYVPGPYSLNLNLKIKKTFEQKYGFFLVLTSLQKCKKGDGGNESTYNCRMSAPNFQTPTPDVQVL